MLIIEVIERTYKKGSDWSSWSFDDAEALISSKDPDGDDIPVEEIYPNVFQFTEDFSVRLYKLRTVANEVLIQYPDDFAKKENLLHMRINDPDELRFWFKDFPPGDNLLVLDLIDDTVEFFTSKPLGVRDEEYSQLYNN